MKTIRIPQGNEFSLFVPLVLKGGEAIDTQQLSGVVVTLQRSRPREAFGVDVTTQDNFVVVTPKETLPLGSYDLTIAGDYEGRDVAVLFNNCFAVCEWTNGSDFDKYLVSQEIYTEQQVLIGAYLNDAELEALKAQYRAAIADAEAAEAAAEAAREAYDEKAEMLDDVAKETTSQEIKTLILQEGIERASEYAQEINEIIGDWDNE